MSRLCIAAALFALSACATTEMDADPVDPVTRDSDPVPMRIVETSSASGYITIPVRFDGVEQQCMLDTGAQTSVAFATPLFASRKTSGSIWHWGISGKAVPSWIIHFSRIEIGGTLVPARDLILNEEIKPGSVDYPCVIGMNVLRSGTLLFDFKKSVFRILRAMPPGYASGALPTRMSGSFRVPINLDGVLRMALWDSGASISAVDRKFVRDNGARFQFIRKLPGIKDISSEKGVQASLYLVKNVELTGKLLPQAYFIDGNLDFAVNDREDAIVGFNLIRQFNWAFDLQNRRWATF